jgi:hypothetical protein
MVRNVIGPEEGAELKRLYEEYVAAINHAAGILRTEGMDSPRFLEADKAAGTLRRRIREILGTAGSDWKA